MYVRDGVIYLSEDPVERAKDLAGIRRVVERLVAQEQKEAEAKQQAEKTDAA